MAFAAAAAFSATAPAASYDIDTYAEVTYNSRYIWRGMDMQDTARYQEYTCTNAEKCAKDNEDAIQPGVTFYWGNSGQSLNIWGSAGLDDSHDLDEVDVTWDYTKSQSEGYETSFGLTYYAFPKSDQDTIEAYAGIAFPKVILAPSVMVFADFGAGAGYYTTAGISHTVPVSNNRTLDFSLSGGYSDGYWGTEPGVTDVTLSVSSTMKVGTVFVIPSVNYALCPDNRVNRADDELWFGISAISQLQLKK